MDISVFAKPNDEIMRLFGNGHFTIPDQQKFFMHYMSYHLFDEGTHLVVQKYFPNVSSALIKAKSFTESDLDDIKLVHMILACSAYIPAKYFIKLFRLPNSLYEFPTLAVNNDGIPTNKVPPYAPFNHFTLRKYNRIIPTKTESNIALDMHLDPEKIPDNEMLDFIISNDINHIQINLRPNNPIANPTNYTSVDCTIYPKGIETCSAVFDTLFNSDYLLKYIYNVWIKMLVYNRTVEDTKQQTFLIGMRNIDGFYKVSNIVNHSGFTKLINTIRLFMLKNKLNNLESNKKISDSYAIFGAMENETDTELCVQIYYENINFHVEKNTSLEFQEKYQSMGIDEYVIQLAPLEVNPVITYKLKGEYVSMGDLPLFAKVFLMFLNQHYKDIKTAFPIYERLENIVYLCAINDLQNHLKMHDNLDSFVMPEKTFKTNSECCLVGVFPYGIMCSGGVIHMPMKYTSIPTKPYQKIMPIPFQITEKQKKPNRVMHITRSLGQLPIQAGIASHSAILQIYDGKAYMTEYGLDSKSIVSQKEIPVPDNYKSFDVDGKTWIMVENRDNPISGDISPEKVKARMEAIVNARGDYSLPINNCHMAVDDTLRAIGVPIDKPFYNDLRSAIEKAKK